MAPNSEGEAYDLLVVGSGPGGYVAAIRAGQLGMKVGCVESQKLGGVCLNIGCIPTKALLTSALKVNELKSAQDHGIQVKDASVDLAPAQERSRQVADQLNRGVGHLFKKNKVEHIQGHGRLTADGDVEVEDGEGNTTTYSAKNVLLATGASPRSLPMLQIDGDRIWSSDDALEQTEAPETLAVVGAGAIGTEFADIYEAFGSEVTIIEAMDRVLPLEDAEISAELEKAFKKRGMGVHTGASLESTEYTDAGVRLAFTDSDGSQQTLEVDRVLAAVGRVPNTDDVGLDAAGVALTEKGGFVEVHPVTMATNVPGIYAVGDCAGGALLAHKASHEGVAAVEHMAGQGHGGVDYANIPNCVYCHPEVASVGLTEEAAREAGHDVEVGKFPWVGNGRALAAGDSQGFVKVVRDKRYSEVLGAHIIGPHATELIGEFVVGRHLETTAEEMDLAVHPHPTLSEAVAEAALASLGRPLHI